MFCIQCGTDNVEGAKYCASCNAVIPAAAPTGNPAASNLDIEEMVEYPIPETHYQSPVLQHLAWTVHEFIEEGAELEPIIDAFESFREIYQTFKEEVPKLEDLCYSQQGQLEDDVMPSQIRYMVLQAERLYEEGEQIFESYWNALDSLGAEDDFPDAQPLIDATKKWLMCNDSICITYDFLVGRAKAFEELTDELEELKQERIASGDWDLEEETEEQLPTDSTEVR